MNKAAAYFIFTVLVTITVPGFITLIMGTTPAGGFDVPLKKTAGNDYGQKITVINPETNEKNEMNLEAYICGVVAAEMPPSFEPEALKAQAVAARTYAYRRIKDSAINPESITGENIAGIFQAYVSANDLKRKWGDDFNKYYKKIEDAVKATEGEIMVYEDIPIEAVFHSTSAGRTEDAENVWLKEYPYLKSVESTGDTMSPEYISETSFGNQELLNILRDKFSGLYLTDSNFLQQFQIISRSEAGYVETVQVGNLTLSGRQIREALDLKSSAFTVSQNGDTVTFKLKGYGHGVGLSQYGANAMAESGYAYKDILGHYYSGINIDTIRS